MNHSTPHTVRHNAALPVERWEQFAQTNAEHYILTDRASYATAEARAYFFQTGEQVAAQILAWCGPWLPDHRKAVEIGCGVGRVTLAMAPHFEQVVGVDVAPTMLAQLERNCAQRGVAHVLAQTADEPWETPSDASLVYSWLVMQHLEERAAIDRYLARISRALAPQGVACLQFDTRPATWLYRLRNHLPDFALPGCWRRSIRRLRRDAATLRQMFAAHGLVIVDEQNPRSPLHVFLVKRTAP